MSLFEAEHSKAFSSLEADLVGQGAESRPRSEACLDSAPCPTTMAEKGGKAPQGILDTPGTAMIGGHFRCAVKGTFSLHTDSE